MPISFVSNAEIDRAADSAAATMDADTAAAEAEKQKQAVETHLVALVWREFSDAERAKQSIQSEMLDLLRARRSMYTAVEMALIEEEGGGSLMFVPLTQEKVATAVALLCDIYLNESERPYSAEPTPIPDLPEEVKAIIEQEVRQGTMMMMPALTDPKLLREYLEGENDRVLQEGREFAKRRARANEDKIEDTFVQGGFYKALYEALDDMCGLRAAFLKGPTVRMEKVWEWARDGSGAQVVRKPVRTYSAPSPFDIYPAPGIATLQQGHLSERIRMTVQELTGLKGVEGFRGDKIDEAIVRYGTDGTQNWWWEDSERQHLEARGDANMLITAKGLYDVIEHHTFATGKMLIDWGTPVSEVLDPAEVYSVVCWMLGKDMLIGARLNDDPLGRRPYEKMCFRRMRGSFWGDSVTDILAPIQKMCNAAMRSMCNNMAMSAGYITEMQIDRMPENTPIKTPAPYSVHQTLSSKTGTQGPAIHFSQPQINAQIYMAVYSFGSMLADAAVGLPSFMSGTSSGGGAGDTSSGLAQLREMAQKTFKFTLRGVDDAVAGVADNTHTDVVLLERQDNPMLTGDVDIKAKGSAAFGDRQQQQVRLNELITATNNPTDLAILKMEGRAELLRAAFKTFDGIDLERTIPSREKLILEAKQAMAASLGLDINGNPLPGAMPGAGGAPGGDPRAGRATMPDGSVQGERVAA